jgi:TPR repeat protein
MADIKGSSARIAYKWLCAAADFGHEEADELIGDLFEVSSLRYDDSRYETAAAHWELAVAYLEGQEGLPLDLRRADQHLTRAFEQHTLDAINGALGQQYSSDGLLGRLPGDAKQLLERHLSGDLHNRVINLVSRVRRLREINAPEAMIAAEQKSLRQAADALFRATDVDPGSSEISLDEVREMVRRTMGES